MVAYYNEWEPEQAQWIRELIAEGLIAAGDVDERDIREVKADDLRGYTQCHFFAGIGGWSEALRIAGWSDDRPVWTGSCPCQPFSNAGSKKAQADERHLWPAWYGLISQCKPPIVFGEQVESAIADGWLDDVHQGLEREGYAFGSAVLPAISVSRGHTRNRLWFVGDLQYDGLPPAQEQGGDNPAVQWGKEGQDSPGEFAGAGIVPSLASDWVRCPDGKRRPVEPGIPMLAHGVSKDLAGLCSKGFGNAIVPEVAARFIRAAA